MTLDLFLVLKFHVILGVILACVTYQLNFQLVKTNYHAPYKHISSFSSFCFVAVLGLEGVILLDYIHQALDYLLLYLFLAVCILMDYRYQFYHHQVRSCHIVYDLRHDIYLVLVFA